MFCPFRCLIVVFSGPFLALRSLRWGREKWLLCLSLVCGLCAVCIGLFAIPLSVIGGKPAHDKTYNKTCVTSKHLVQTAHC